jgi:hypothetical protein
VGFAQGRENRGLPLAQADFCISLVARESVGEEPGGNAGSNDDSTPSYPSNYNVANVITVAAINKSRRLASWSNYGATTVDLGAPAVGV